MAFSPIQRATLLFPTGSARDPHAKHLQILLTDPVGHLKEVLMVGVSTLRGKYADRTCILQPGDHEFIDHESYVTYSHCRIERSTKLVNGINQNLFIDKGLLAPSVFNRVTEGLLVSDRTGNFAKTFYTEFINQSKK